MIRHFLPTLVLALAIAGCAMNPPIALGPGPQNLPGVPSQTVGTELQGIVSAPAGVISAGGGNVITAGGGNVITAGGGNVITAGGGNFGVLDTDEKPLAGTSVFAADMAGNALNIPAVTTDTNGHYTLKNLPLDAVIQVVATVKTASGSDAQLMGLIRTADTNPDLAVNFRSTCLAAYLLQQVHGAVGTMDQQTWNKAVDTMDGLVTYSADDLLNKAALIAKVQSAESQSSALKQMVDGMAGTLVPNNASATATPTATPH